MGRAQREARRAAEARRRVEREARVLSNGDAPQIVLLIAAGMEVLGGWPADVARAAAERAFLALRHRPADADSARAIFAEAARLADAAALGEEGT